MLLESNKIILPSITTVMSLAIVVVFGHANSLMAYKATDFYLWQLITTHFVHYDMRHLVSNMLALFFLVFIFPFPIANIIKGFIVAIFLIDAYLLLFGIAFYVGFSGLVYVVPGIACATYLIERKILRAMVLLSMLLIYIYLFSQENYLSANISWHSLKQAHLLGFFGGSLAQMTSKTDYKT